MSLNELIIMHIYNTHHWAPSIQKYIGEYNVHHINVNRDHLYKLLDDHKIISISLSDIKDTQTSTIVGPYVNR